MRLESNGLRLHGTYYKQYRRTQTFQNCFIFRPHATSLGQHGSILRRLECPPMTVYYTHGLFLTYRVYTDLFVLAETRLVVEESKERRVQKSSKRSC